MPSPYLLPPAACPDGQVAGRRERVLRVAGFGGVLVPQRSFEFAPQVTTDAQQRPDRSPRPWKVGETYLV